MRIADVALPVPIARAFSYEVPPRFAVAAGARVVCAFGARRLVGVVLDVHDGESPASNVKVKPLLHVIGDEPAVPTELLTFLRAVAQYYLAPIGEVVCLALPPATREIAQATEGPSHPSLFNDERARAARGVGARKVHWVVPTDSAASTAKLGAQAAAILAHVRGLGPTPLARLETQWPNARAAVKRLSELGLTTKEEREAPPDPFFAGPATRDAPPAPTASQAAAIAEIARALREAAERRGTTFLLHGVTGSGKTEVYLRSIAAAREAKAGTIVLVPEIALTPQLVSRFRARFGDDVAVVHSGLTPKERHTMWKRLHSGEVDVAIGARSALFAPVRALGLVIVDEEHDSSFKQEEGVRYHARDMAILRAHRAGGVCVLGSATPSLETEQLARTGKAHKLVLPDRARAQRMPRVDIVDLRRIGPGPTGDKRLSLPLHRALEATLEAREQAILFLNRRGFSPSVRCEACGEVWSCPSCSVALTFHKRSAILRCHYCEYETPIANACPACHAPALALEGLGTEKLEETLAAAFPSARIARLDRDVASGRAIEKVLERVRAREVDILVGTQMVAKGHDLPHVTLVGVINADAALSLPDFRAAERAFQLLVQVAGRAGRGEVPGRVLVQTYNPAQEAIVYAAHHDVNGFLECELRNRRELMFPPFSRMAMARVDGPDEAEAREAARVLQRAAANAARELDASIDVKDVSTAPIARLRNRFRFRVVVRSADRAALRKVLLAMEHARAELARTVRAVRVVLDVDPVQFL